MKRSVKSGLAVLGDSLWHHCRTTVLEDIIYANDRDSILNVLIVFIFIVFYLCTLPARLSCPRPVELLHWVSASTFPEPWRAQPCFHTLQHGGTRDPTRAAPRSDVRRRPPTEAAHR